MFVYNFPHTIQMFGRRQYLVNSRDRATGSATNFLYRLPNQMRDVVHVNLLHCIVENGVFNVDDTNNKFMLNQESNTLDEELGDSSIPIDFPYLGNQILVYKDASVGPVYYGVGKGGNALMWCEPTLQPDTPISLDWKVKQPLNAQIWNNNIGNPTELMCIASNQTGTIVAGGNNLVAQGYGSNFAVSLDANVGGLDSTFDTQLATGGPSKSVNAIAYASVGGTPMWVCTGDDSLANIPTAIKIDDTNNQALINVFDPSQTKFAVNNNSALIVFASRFTAVNDDGFQTAIAPQMYTRETYVEAMNLAMTDSIGSLTSPAFSSIEFEVNEFGTVSAYAIVSVVNPSYDPTRRGGYYFRAIGMANNLWGLEAGSSDVGGELVFGVRYADIVLANIGDRIPFRLYGASLTGLSQFPAAVFPPTIQIGIPESNISVNVPDGNYTPTAFALELQTRINASLNALPVFSLFGLDLQITYDQAEDSFVFIDATATPYLSVSLNQFGDTQTPVRVAFAKILGLLEGYAFAFETTESLAPSPVGYNLKVPCSTWTSSDGIDWIPIKDPLLQNIVGHSISIIDTTTGPAVVIGTDDGIVYNDSNDFTVWFALGKSTQLSEIKYGKVYAVETALNPTNNGVIVAFGCLGGQVYFDDDFWATATPTPTLLTTLTRSPNSFDPVCNAIKFTGDVTGSQPTWIFAGSSMSFISSDTALLTGKTVTLVPFNSGPALDPAGYPFIEYINGIATYEDDAGVVYTALVGDNTGQYSCTDITASATLDSWTGIQPFKNNVLIQIPVGYYTNTSLASTISELLNNQAISGNGTFYTEVEGDGTFVISNTTSGNWGIRFMNGTIEFIKTAGLLGFSDVSKQYRPSVLQGQDGPYTLKSDVEGGLNLVPFEYVLVQSDKFGNELMTNSGLSAWWLVPNLANGVNSNSIVYENTRNPTLEYLTNPRDIEQFDIRILNSNGGYITLQDNSNVALVIEFYTKKTGCR